MLLTPSKIFPFPLFPSSPLVVVLIVASSGASKMTSGALTKAPGCMSAPPSPLAACVQTKTSGGRSMLLTSPHLSCTDNMSISIVVFPLVVVALIVATLAAALIYLVTFWQSGCCCLDAVLPTLLP